MVRDKTAGQVKKMARDSRIWKRVEKSSLQHLQLLWCLITGVNVHDDMGRMQLDLQAVLQAIKGVAIDKILRARLGYHLRHAHELNIPRLVGPLGLMRRIPTLARIMVHGQLHAGCIVQPRAQHIALH